MGTVLIRHQRKIFNTGNVENERSTIGEIFVDGKYFCYVLEDEVRADGKKVMHKTAIPAIVYDVAVTYSPKFKRNMILLYNKPDFSIEHEGVRFTGVRVHKGVRATNSSGCPIVGFKTDGITVTDEAETELLKIVQTAIKAGKKVKWSVEVKPFNNGLDNQILN